MAKNEKPLINLLFSTPRGFKTTIFLHRQIYFWSYWGHRPLPCNWQIYDKVATGKEEEECTRKLLNGLNYIHATWIMAAVRPFMMYATINLLLFGVFNRMIDEIWGIVVRSAYRLIIASFCKIYYLCSTSLNFKGPFVLIAFCSRPTRKWLLVTIS